MLLLKELPHSFYQDIRGDRLLYIVIHLKRQRGFKLVPPADLILYFRVLSGVKGLLTKLDASVDLQSAAIAIAKERGIYTGPK